MKEDLFEVAIIGAGPGGISAAANAARHSLSHVLIEKAEIGNTIYDYQLRKHVMAEPGRLRLVSPIQFEASTRERVLESWKAGLKEHNVNILKAEVTAVEKGSDGTFSIQCSGTAIRAKQVVLAIGVQGAPRKLGVPGDDMAHVASTLSDPDAFRDKDILIVGAGDAAIENALALAPHNRVSLLNRTSEFPRAKDANAAAIVQAEKAGELTIFSNSTMNRIAEGFCVIDTEEGEVEIQCDHIIARIGTIPPRSFMSSCGIKYPNNSPDAVPVVSRRYESNVENLFVIGALIGYPLIKQAMNQGFEVIEHILGHDVEPADQPLLEASLAVLPGTVQENLEMLMHVLPLLTDLSEPQLRELVIDSSVHRKEKDAMIFSVNDYTDSFFQVVEGTAKIELPNGKTVSLGPGSYFGEMSLLSGRRRSATIRMGESGVLLESPRKQILKLINSVDPVKKKIDRHFMINALQTKIFPEVARESIEALVQNATTRRYKKDEVLFAEGDPGDAFYVIRKGSVKISRKNASGKDIAQTYIAAGNYVGEMALLGDDIENRSATCTAAVPCEVILLDRADFRIFLKNNPESAKRIEALAEQRSVENAFAQRDTESAQILDFIVSQGVTDAENVLIINSNTCIGCDNCESACAATHGGYSRLDRKRGSNFASIQVPVSCRHCENPLCMIDCPPDALVRLPDGEVVIQDSCIGCGNCVTNCPYGVMQMYYEKRPSGFSLLNIFRRKSNDPENAIAKAGKCDLCSTLPGGPACVRACPTGAAIRVNPDQLLQIISDQE